METAATDSVPLPTREEIAAAALSVRPYVQRTPLVRLVHPGNRQIYLKLESLQPIGSFKLRCATNALLARRAMGCSRLVTASAGNFAQGLAYAGRHFGVEITTFVPDTAARTKLDALDQLGARIVVRPYEQWWEMMESTHLMRNDPCFIHPVADTAVLAGNGTIGLEILQDLPEVETIFAPFGGGGLAVGIATAIHAQRPDARVYACETEAGTPVAAAFSAGKPVRVTFNSRTFITGMGSSTVLAPMWPLIRAELAGTTFSTLEGVARAIKLLLTQHHIVAEGAGAAPVAAALAEPDGGGPLVCIVSGGHLDLEHLKEIIEDRIPVVGLRTVGS
jgi:threonine dehydratase